MKTLGQQVRGFREERGWKTGDLAKKVGTSRQNIESLEATGNRIPKYLGDLAAVMGTTVDQMLAEAGLRPPVAEVKAEREIPAENVFEALTAMEQEMLTDFRILPDEDQAELREEIRARAVKARHYIEKVMRQLPIRGPEPASSETSADTYRTKLLSKPQVPAAKKKAA